MAEMSVISNFYMALSNLQQCREHIVEQVNTIEYKLKAKKSDVPPWRISQYVVNHSSLPEAWAAFTLAKAEVTKEREIQKKLNFYLYNKLKTLLNIDRLIQNLAHCRHWHGGLWKCLKEQNGSSKKPFISESLEREYENAYGDVQWIIGRVHQSKYDLKLFDTGSDIASEIGI